MDDRITFQDLPPGAKFRHGRAVLIKLEHVREFGRTHFATDARGRLYVISPDDPVAVSKMSRRGGGHHATAASSYDRGAAEADGFHR